MFGILLTYKAKELKFENHENGKCEVLYLQFVVSENTVDAILIR